MVLVLVLLPPLAGALGGTARRQPAPDCWSRSALTLLQGRRVRRADAGRRAGAFFPWLLWQVARTGSRELFTLCVVAAAVGIAYGVGGAVRRVVRARRVLRRHGAARVASSATAPREESLPLRDAFAVLFFVSVGMLFDPTRARRASRCSVLAVVGDHRGRQVDRGVRCWCCCSAIR